jgi:primosomal protein N' (replication factor Y)
MPKDAVLQHVAENDYKRFFRDEITYRHELMYPPFAHFIRVTVMHESEERVIPAAQELANRLRGQQIKTESHEDPAHLVRILGPAPAVLSKLRNNYRWQILIKGKKLAVLRKIAHTGVDEFFGSGFSSGIALSIEVNPLR